MNKKNESQGASDFFRSLRGPNANELSRRMELNAEICFGLCQAYLRGAGLTLPIKLRTATQCLRRLLQETRHRASMSRILAESLVPERVTLL